MRHLLSPVLALALVGCNKAGDTDGETDGPVYTGCITVSGGGGWDTIAEALANASDGQVVELCDAVYEESVVVDKSVTIEGLGDDTVWGGALNEHTLTIAAGAVVTLREVGMISSRNAIEVQPGGVLVVEDSLFFGNIGGYAIHGADADITVNRVEIGEAAGGGVLVEGGTLTVADSLFDGTNAFGIMLERDAIGTISGNTFQNIVPTGETVSDDGWAVLNYESSATLSGNTFSTNLFGDVWSEGTLSSLTMDGDTSTGAIIGVWLNSASATLTNVTIDGYTQYGIVVDGGQTLDLTDVTLTTDPATAPYAETAALDDLAGSFGVLAFGPDITMVGGRIAGNNGAGLWHHPGNDTSALLTMDGVVVDDNARLGIASILGEMTLTDVTVSNTRDHDETCFVDYSISCNMAIAAWESSLVMDGGTIEGNGMFGVSVVYGSAQVTNTTFSENGGEVNGYGGLWGYTSSVTCDTCTFENGKQYSLFLQSGATGLVTNSVFRNGSHYYVYEWESEGNTYKQESYFQSIDAYATSSDLIVQNTTFENGERGVVGSSGTLEITDSTFTGLNSQAISGWSGTVNVSRTELVDVGDSALSCSSATFVADKVKITGVPKYDYKYVTYLNGELSSSSEGTYPSDALYAYGCDLVFDDVSITDVTGAGMWLYDTSISFDGFSLRGVGIDGWQYESGIQAAWYNVPAEAWLNDVEVTGVEYGSAISLSGSSSYPGHYVEMSNLRLGQDDGSGHAGMGATGITLTSIDNAILSGVDITGAATDGIQLSSVNGTITGATTESTGTITAPGNNGLNANSSTLTITGLTVTSPGLSGLALTAGSYTVEGNTVETAAEYGMTCTSDPELLSCDANSFSGTLGDVDGRCACP